MDKGKASMDMTCDLTIKGHYKAFSNSPIVQSLLGADSVRGDGNTKVKIGKCRFSFISWSDVFFQSFSNKHRR